MKIIQKPASREKTYDECVKKFFARKAILDWWRDLTQAKAIPCDYWTLGGPLYDEETGRFAEASASPDELIELHSTGRRDFSFGCELSHIMNFGYLKKASQFHSAERKTKIYKGNIRAVSPMKERPTLYHGDIAQVMSDALVKGTLRPSIVNLDTLQEPKGAVELLGQVLDIVNQVRVPKQKMIALNIVIDQPYRGKRYKQDDVLAEEKKIQTKLQGWSQEDGWGYPGTAKTSTKMLTRFYFHQGGKHVQPHRQ